MKLRHLLVLVRGSRARRRLAGDRAQQSRRVARRRVDCGERRAPGRRLGAGRRAAWSHGRAGPRAASARSSRPRAAPGFSSSSTTRASARRSLFTVGLLTYAACPALVAHAALAYPGGRLAGRARTRGARARLREHDRSCSGCFRRWSSTPPRRDARSARDNLLALTSAPGLVDDARRAGPGPRPGLGACARRARGLADRRARPSAARLLTAPVLLAAVAYLGARRRRLRAQPRPRVPLQRRHRQAALARAGGGAGSACARRRAGLGARMAGADGGGAPRHRAQRRAGAGQAARRARPRARRPRARARLPARLGAPRRRARPRRSSCRRPTAER